MGRQANRSSDRQAWNLHDLRRRETLRGCEKRFAENRLGKSSIKLGKECGTCERLRAAPDDRPKAATRVARSSACTVWCARRVLDTADIVREAIFHDSITVGGSPNFYLPTTKGFVSGAGAGCASLKSLSFPPTGASLISGYSSLRVEFLILRRSWRRR